MWGRPQGWAINNPANNYWYSFLLATCWAQRVCPEIKPLAQIKIDQAIAHYANADGGSREGSGYGVSKASLYGAFDAFESGALSDHAAKDIDYIIHATTPDFKHFALFGDQPLRQGPNPPVIGDRVIIWMLCAYAATSNELARGRARFWIFRSRWYHEFAEKKYNVYLQIDMAGLFEKPTAQAYYSEYTGHYFWRSSWDDSAIYYTQSKKPEGESHAVEGCGAINIWANGKWQAMSQSAYSRDGLITSSSLPTGTFVQNMIRFVDMKGATIKQRGTPGPNGEALYTDALVKSRRSLSFVSDAELTIVDTVTAPKGGEVLWQINTQELPVVVEKIVSAGDLIIEFETDKIKIEKWSDIHANYGKGYRVTAEFNDLVETITTTIIDKSYVAAPVVTPPVEPPKEKTFAEKLAALGVGVICSSEQAKIAVIKL
jgi:hypothetical protein